MFVLYLNDFIVVLTLFILFILRFACLGLIYEYFLIYKLMEFQDPTTPSSEPDFYSHSSAFTDDLILEESSFSLHLMPFFEKNEMTFFISLLRKKSADG